MRQVLIKSAQTDTGLFVVCRIGVWCTTARFSTSGQVDGHTHIAAVMEFVKGCTWESKVKFVRHVAYTGDGTVRDHVAHVDFPPSVEAKFSRDLTAD